MPEQLGWAAAVSATLACVLVGAVRRHALRRGVLDHPTDRSSHDVPTPRGGGLGLLLAAVGLGMWRAAQSAEWTMLMLLLGASLVALVGWVDDQRGLAVRTRLLVHLIAAVGVGLAAAGDAPTASVAAALFVWWTFWTVSSINLVNFMDGINGLVASQLAIFATSLSIFPPATASASYYATVVGAACIGFIPWNFPRARIFLGDVGSGGLGYLVPVLALLAMRAHGVDIVRAHLPLLPLFADATFTILRRWRKGERVTAPHRSHLYQRLANGGMGHSRVTILYGVAALTGAAAAHAGPFSPTAPWILLYACAIIVLGVRLDRSPSAAARLRT